MKKPALRVVSNTAESTAKIFLYGIIGDYWTDDPLTAKAFMRELSALEGKYSRVDIHVNSPGGVVWEGLAIVNAIKASKMDIHTYNDGLAASMAAVILAAPQKLENRHAAKGSLTMIHNASTIAWGNSKSMRETADMLDSHDDVLADIFADATGRTKDEIKADYMDHVDHWLTAEEAAAAGLITIESYQADSMPDNITNMSIDKVAALYTGTPEENSPSFIDKVKNIMNDIINSKNQITDMKFPKIEALVKVPAAELTEDLVNAVQTELAEAGIEGVIIVLESEQLTLAENAEKVPALEASIATLTTEKEALTAEVATLTEKLNKPAEEAASAVTDNDKIQDSEEKSVFTLTSVDAEKAKILKDWQ